MYFYRNVTSCKLIYFDFEDGKIKKRLREISFSDRASDPLKCVLTFKRIAQKFNEYIPKDDATVFNNGVYTYFKGKYDGEIQVYDMNSAYLWVLSQPLADFSTRQECTIKDIFNKKFDYYSFENELHKIMFYKEDIEKMKLNLFWADLKIYGYKSKVFFKNTAEELFKLKKINPYYKNVANLTIGCMHKKINQNNSATLASSLYAFFEWHISNLVAKLKKKGYNVIMITTDSVKIAGHYDEKDGILPIGNNLGEFKLEYEGEAKYYSIGHYFENKEKWKGKPEYLRAGYKPCLFIENIKEELPIYEDYAKL